VRLRAACPSAAAARALRDAVAADTPTFVRLAVRGAALEIQLRAPSAASARATVDDLLACLKTAEALLAGARRPATQG
jgi:hypothetical protein